MKNAPETIEWRYSKNNLIEPPTQNTLFTQNNEIVSRRKVSLRSTYAVAEHMLRKTLPLTAAIDRKETFFTRA